MYSLEPIKVIQLIRESFIGSEKFILKVVVINYI